MKPLSPLLYLKRKFKNAVPVFASIILGVFLIYLYSIFSVTTIKMEEVAYLDLMEKYNIAYIDNRKSLPESFLNELRELDSEGMIAVQMNLSGLAYYRGGMGGTTMLTFNLFEDDTARLLKNCGVNLVEGRLPKNNQYEIIVPREYILQNKVGVGDYIGSQVSDEYTLVGKYKICGITEGPVIFSVVCQPGSETKEQIMKRGIMYPVDNLSAELQKSLLEGLPSYVHIRSYDSYMQELAAINGAMQSLTYILTAIMIIVLCISLGNINVILFASREEEFTILNTIGYTKGKLSKKLWDENIITCLAGYIIGISITEFVIWMINNIILYPQGKVLEFFNLPGMIAALAVPIFVSFFSLLPCMMHNFSKHENIIV